MFDVHTHLSFTCTSWLFVCCHVEVSATSWSFVQRSSTDCDVSLCVIQKLKQEEVLERVGPQRHRKKKVWSTCTNKSKVLTQDILLGLCTVLHVWRSEIAQSVWQLATGWTVRGSNPSGPGEIFRTRPDPPWAHPGSYTIGTGSLSGVKRPRGGVDHPPHLSPRLKKE